MSESQFQFLVVGVNVVVLGGCYVFAFRWWLRLAVAVSSRDEL